MSRRLAALAGTAYTHRKAVLAAWIGALVIAIALAGAIGGEFAVDYSTPGSQSRAAAQVLKSDFGGRSPETVDVVWQTQDADAAKVDAFLAKAATLKGIADAPKAAGAQVSPDGQIAVARLQLSVRAPNVPKATGTELLDMRDQIRAQGVKLELGGEVIQTAQQGPISSEAVGLTVAALILLISLGTIVAAGLPLLLALFGLGISTALIGLLAAVIDTPDWAVTLAAMLGIGVGIDYALLILTRHRAALANGASVQEAVTEAVSTAGRSVLVAGTTVVISLLGLFAMGLSYLYGVAIAAILAVLVVMLAALTLFPALLGLAGRKLERLKVPFVHHTDTESPRAARWSAAVQRRPWPAAIVGTAILLLLAAPAFGLWLGFPDAGNDRASTTTRKAYDLVADHFGAGANGPLMVVAPAARAAGVAAKLQADSGLASVSAPQTAGGHALILATAKTSPQASATGDTLERLRGRLGAGVLIGGRTAEAVDQADTTRTRLPLFIGVVVGLSLLLLLVAFRSVVVAIKAAIMNMLSVGAAYGVVAVLAHGGAPGRPRRGA